MTRILISRLRVILWLLMFHYGYHCILLLYVEPQMGFGSMADYFDPELLRTGLATVPWYLSNFLHIMGGFGLALLGFALRIPGQRLKAGLQDILALFSGLLFFVVGISGFAGYNSTLWISDGLLQPVMAGWAIFRYTILLAAVVATAFFIGLLGYSTHKYFNLPKWFSFCSYGIAALLCLFLLFPIPAPLLLFCWSLLFLLALTKNVPGGKG